MDPLRKVVLDGILIRSENHQIRPDPHHCDDVIISSLLIPSTHVHLRQRLHGKQQHLSSTVQFLVKGCLRQGLEYDYRQEFDAPIFRYRIVRTQWLIGTAV